MEACYSTLLKFFLSFLCLFKIFVYESCKLSSYRAICYTAYGAFIEYVYDKWTMMVEDRSKTLKYACFVFHIWREEGLFMSLWWMVLVFFLCFVVGLLIWFRLQYHKYTRNLPKPSFQMPVQTPNIQSWTSEQFTLTWVGHSTILMNMCGRVLLTDPVFSHQVGVSILGYRVGPKRYTAPAILLSQLPPIDTVFLSHAHMDHADLPSLRKVIGPTTEIVTASGTSPVLRRLKARNIVELGGKESAILESGLHVQAVPVRHWGNRYPWNKSYGYTGYLIEFQGFRVFFAGDTAHIDTLQDLRDHGPIDVACIPIGAYAPERFQGSHCTPEQAWDMFLQTGARWLIPIHWNTFVLSEEPVTEPIERLLRVAGEDKERIVIREQGQTFICTH